jgi:hypothetical protein
MLDAFFFLFFDLNKTSTTSSFSKQITIKLSLAADEISAPQEPPPLYVRENWLILRGEAERNRERDVSFFPHLLLSLLSQPLFLSFLPPSRSSPSRAWATCPRSRTAPWTPSGTCCPLSRW